MPITWKNLFHDARMHGMEYIPQVSAIRAAVSARHDLSHAKDPDRGGTVLDHMLLFVLSNHGVFGSEMERRQYSHLVAEIADAGMATRLTDTIWQVLEYEWDCHQWDDERLDKEVRGSSGLLDQEELWGAIELIFVAGLGPKLKQQVGNSVAQRPLFHFYAVKSAMVAGLTPKHISFLRREGAKARPVVAAACETLRSWVELGLVGQQEADERWSMTAKWCQAETKMLEFQLRPLACKFKLGTMPKQVHSILDAFLLGPRFQLP